MHDKGKQRGELSITLCQDNANVPYEKLLLGENKAHFHVTPTVCAASVWANINHGNVMVYAPLFQGVIHTSGGQISPSVHCSRSPQLCALKLLQVCVLDDTFIVQS